MSTTANHPCYGCVDWVSESGGYSNGMVCDYIGHTGHARSLICGAGARCTVKSTVPREGTVECYDAGGYVVRNRKRPGPKPKLNPGEVRRLATTGLTDRAIAEKLGCASNTVFTCRKKHNIPAGVPANSGRPKV